MIVVHRHVLCEGLLFEGGVGACLGECECHASCANGSVSISVNANASHAP